MKFRTLRHFAIQMALTPLFRSSQRYWNQRYALGGDSGTGSFGRISTYKADYLNSFVRENSVGSIIEFGCGNGQQLRLAKYPKYLGLDVSKTAIDACLSGFDEDPNKSFFYFDSLHFADNARFLSADLSLSIDVIYHLVEDAVYKRHLDLVFNAAQRFCIIYSTNIDKFSPMPHVRHRPFLSEVETKYPDWQLIAEELPGLPDQTPARFFVFARKDLQEPCVIPERR